MGEAFARRFLEEGWGVLALDLSAQALADAGERLPAELREHRVEGVVDVADREGGRRAIAESKVPGEMRAAVTAAGICPPTNVKTYTEELYRRTFDVNVLGTLNVAAEVIEHLRSRKLTGSIVTISSASAFGASVEQILYSASKAAVVSLTRVLAASVATEGIVVNGIAPGWVNTPGNAATGRIIGAEARVPLGRVAQPEEIAEWVWTLASGKTSFLTGETIKVTGGEVMTQ